MVFECSLDHLTKICAGAGIQNDLFGVVIARVQTEFSVQVAPMVDFIQFILADPYVWMVPLSPPSGRISNPTTPPPKAVLERASVLSNFCARNLYRVKSRNSMPRLVIVSNFLCDARLTNGNDRIPVTLTPSETTILVRSEYYSETIDRKTITDILPLNEPMLAIVANNIQYCFDFSPRGCQHFIDKLTPLSNLRFYPAPTATLVRPWTKKWIKHTITNFDYLCIVNFLSGRVFNSHLKLHPLFPCTDADFKRCINFTIPSLDGLFMNYVSHEISLFAPPEIYFFPQICGSFEKVYVNRKRLERCENLEVWLTLVFGSHRDNFSHRKIFDEPHPRRGHLQPSEIVFLQANIRPDVDDQMLYCFALERAEPTFVCVYESGDVIFGTITRDSAIPQFEQIGIDGNVGDITSGVISPITIGVAVYRIQFWR
jgi:hypothetical protein